VIVEELPHPKPGESSWIIEFKSLTTYRRPVKLAECDVRTSTSRKPLKDWAILGFTFIKSEDAGKVVGYVRNLAGVEVGEREVTSRSEGRVKGGIVTGERLRTSARALGLNVTLRRVTLSGPHLTLLEATVLMGGLGLVLSPLVWLSA
jgi:hypothetical protein